MLELIDASEAERLLRMESAIVEDEYKLRIVDILIDRLMGVRTVNIGEKMHEIEILAGDETLNIIKRVITTSEGAVKERLITRLDTVLAQREWVQKEIKELGAKDDSQSEDERHSLEELERSAKSLELLYEEIYDPDAKYRNVPLEYLLRYLPTDGK